MQLDSKIEAVLFFKGESVSVKKLSQILGSNDADINEALKILEEKLSERGVRLIRHEDEVTLGTAPKAGEIIEKLIKEDLSKDLGKAGLETLSIVIYRGPISRREIDWIRGVNSTFILRNLLIRGLVEKVVNDMDQRSFLYKPTLELLSYLGVTRIEELPEYEKVRAEIEQFAQNQEQSGETAHE